MLENESGNVVMRSNFVRPGFVTQNVETNQRPDLCPVDETVQDMDLVKGGRISEKVFHQQLDLNSRPLSMSRQGNHLTTTTT